MAATGMKPGCGSLSGRLAIFPYVSLSSVGRGLGPYTTVSDPGRSMLPGRWGHNWLVFFFQNV